MRLGSVLAFAAGFVGAAAVVGLAAKSRLTPQAEAIQRRLAADGAALKAEAEAYAARETVRLSARGGYGEQKVRAAAYEAATAYTAELGIPQIKADLALLQRRLASVPNPFNLLG